MENIKKIVDEAYKKSKAILMQHREKLDLLANTLIEVESLEGAQVRELLSLPKNESPKDKDKPSDR